MKRIFTAVTIGLLLSTPHTTHSRLLTKIAALVPISVVSFYAYKEHTYAKSNGSSNPGLHAALTIPDLAAQGLIEAGRVMEGVGIGVMKVIKDARQELMQANKPTQKETPAATTNTEAPHNMPEATQAQPQPELKATNSTTTSTTPEQAPTHISTDTEQGEPK